MNDQFVTFYVGKLARKKGFNEPDKKIFNTIGELWDAHYMTAKNDDVELGMACTAPTQSVLQRWLREKHNCHLYVIPVGLNRFEAHWLKAPGWTWSALSHKSYEEAVEYGLEELLKLI